MSTELTTTKPLTEYEESDEEQVEAEENKYDFPEAVSEWFDGSAAGINTNTREGTHQDLFPDASSRTDDMNEMLSEMITSLVEGDVDDETWDKFETWLQAQSDLTDYSTGNRFLIKMQYPEATFVTGYRKWQDNYNRHVKKGEKAIWIRVPYITGKKCPDCGTTPDYDPDAREKNTDAAPKENHSNCEFDTDPENWSEGVVQWGYGKVFDVSQTDGEPLPDMTGAKGDADDLYDRVHEVATEDYGFNVEDGAVPRLGARGSSDADGGVTVRGYESDANKAKILVHEMAHELMHPKEDRLENRDETDRSAREVEAESVAYIVGRYFGLDVSGSELYIRHWADDAEEEVKKRLDRITETAEELIEAIEGSGE